MAGAMALALSGAPAEAAGPGGGAPPAGLGAPPALGGAAGAAAPSPALPLAALGAPRAPRPPETASDTVLVRFRPGAGATARAAALRAVRATAPRRIRGTSWTVVEVPGRAAAAAALRALRQDAAVDGAEPDHVRRATAAPDDPLFAKGRQGWATTLRLPDAWDRAQASTAQVVAVVDTGVDADHPDLAGRVLPGHDVVNRDSDATDDQGHGTAVASVVAARAGDGVGMAGVAWAPSVLPVKALDGTGRGTDASVAEAIAWAADRGADVINLSLGGPGRSSALEEAVAYARGRGSVVVAAAGNDGVALESWPAAAPGALAVGATDWSGTLAWYSSSGSFVDLVAPGHRIRAARPTDDGGGRWRDGDGTSFAAPVVAGVALLVLAQNPAWTPAQVEDRLLRTALDAGAAGVDPFYGRGLVDPVHALGGAALPAVATPPADGDDAIDRARVLPGGMPVTSVTADLGREGDADWYAVDLAEGMEVSVMAQTATGTGFEDSRAQLSDAVIDVFSPDRDFVGRVDARGIEGYEEASIGAWKPGRWSFRVSSFHSSRGHEPYVFALGTGGLRGWAEPRFTPWIAAPRQGDPVSVAIADVTGDGRPEALQTTADEADSPEDYLLSVYEVDADGEPRRTQALDTGARTTWTADGGTLSSTTMGIATGDLDGDGDTDAAVAAGRWIAVFAQSAGRLGEAQPIPGSQGADTLEAADVDGDGRLDLVALFNREGGPATEPIGVVAFLRRSGGWERRVVTERGTSDIAVGDVDGNGRPDVVGASYGAITVVRQRTDGTWAAAEVIADDTGDGVEVADVTNDGRADVITTSTYQYDPGPTLDLRAQTAAGTLAPPVSLPIFYPGQAIEAGDVDGDGLRDVVVAEDGAFAAGLFRGRADGTLAPEERIPTPAYTSRYQPTGLALGDVTRDGALDIALADYNRGLVLVRRRSPTFPRRQWIREASPAEGQTGVSASVTPVVRLGRALDPASATTSAVRLEDREGTAVAATVAYDAATRTLTVRPGAPLAAGRWALRLDGLRDAQGGAAPPDLAVRFVVGAASTLDAAAPDTSIVSAPTGTTRHQNRNRFASASTEPGATFQCSLDGEPFAACPAEKRVLRDLAEGTHTFRTRAVDAAGRADATPATRTWTIRPTLAPPPNDRFDAPLTLTGASGNVRASSVGAEHDSLPRHLQVTGDDHGEKSIWFRWTAPATGTVRWDTAGSDFDTILGVFSGDPATPAFRRRGEGDDVPGGRTGRVELPVRAGEVLHVGVDGTADPVFAPSGTVQLAWALAGADDTTPPETTITGGPPALETTGRATFTFAASEPAATFECDLDGEGWAPCTSPRTLYHWNGDHVLRVRATDAAGNTDITPASRAWRTDAAPPESRFTEQPPSSTSSSSASFSFEANEPARFECRLDRGPWAACTSPHARTGLAPGPHELDVRAIDTAGHVEPEPTRAAWVVVGETDTTPPDTRITSGPAPISRLSTATLTSTSTEAGSTFECRLDGAAWAPCASPHALGGLAAGAHRFEVRARDAAGNVDATPARRSWTVDLGAPILGDFNGDSRPDLVTGAPGEAVGTAAGAGAVVVLPGGTTGPGTRSARLLHQNVSGVPGTAETGDAWGTALAAGDFDADGYDDLAVGAPGEDAGAGTVTVLRGGRSGLSGTGAVQLDQAVAGVEDDPERGDRLGAALAAARLDGDEREDLAIGVPGESVVSGGTPLPEAGAVHVVPGGPSGLTPTATRTLHRAVDGLEGDPAAGDAFGAALAAADLGGSPHADLAVGAPSDDVGGATDAGAVHVLLGTASGAPAVAGDQMWTQGADGLPDATESADRFGASLAAGALAGGGPADLAAGAPGEGVGTLAGAGAVVVLRGGAAGPVAAGAAFVHQDSADVPGSNEVRDGFGTALAVTRPRGAPPWLAVGAPDENVGSVADAGTVVVLPGGDGAFPAPGGLRVEQGIGGVPDVAEAGDGLGAVVSPLGAALAAGAGAEDVEALTDAGAVLVLPASAGGPTVTGATLWHEDVSGVPGTARADARFGAALGP